MKAWWRAFGLGSTGLMLLGALETTTVRIAAQPTKPIYLLDPMYELELNSEKRAIAGLDLTTVPKNVCVNRAPAVDVLNPFGGADGPAATDLAVRVDQERAINRHIEDDGLPRGSRVTSTWRKTSGPGDAAFSDTSTGPTRVKFTAPGAHVIELSATDGDKANSLKVNVIVS